MVYQHATRQVGDGTGIVILRWPAGQRHNAERVTRSMVLAITSRPLIALDKGEDIAFKLGAEGEQAAVTLAAQLTLSAQLAEADQRIKALADELFASGLRRHDLQDDLAAKSRAVDHYRERLAATEDESRQAKDRAHALELEVAIAQSTNTAVDRSHP